MRIGLENGAEWMIVEQEAFDIPPLESARISRINVERVLLEAEAKL